ncbi:MAG: hypothetical protein V1922_03490 [bacterium]
MKKTWVVTLIALGVVFIVQQTVLSQQSTSHVFLAQGSTIYCDISNYYQHPSRLRTCCISPVPPDKMCDACMTFPVPTVCFPWITLTPGALDATLKGLPTSTPTPTNTPTTIPSPTPTGGGERIIISLSSFEPTPTQSSRPRGAAAASVVGNSPTTPPPGNVGWVINNVAPIIFSSTATPIPTKYYYPTYTPIPTSRTTNSGSQVLLPSPTNVPSQVIPNIPTPQYIHASIPTPTIPFIPNSLTAQKAAKENKTTYTLDTKALTEIKIVPNAYAAKNMPTERPLLPQEQRLLAKNETPAAGGILVTLEQKMGNAFVTRQDELTVKRGDQFFTISNQPSSSTTQEEQKAQQNVNSQSNTSLPSLEINANNVIALSNMGLSVDPLSGILTVQTPNGPQRVSIMPDEALGIVIELKALNAKGKIEPSILLVSENGALIYRISGEKVEKFLGLFPFPIKKQILVSADTGSVVKVELSLLSRILSYFTF